jgi:EamA domain-containing membrane protein RarD
MVVALIVGALTAWYLGLNLGIVVAVVTAAAMVIAMFVPGMSLAVYALVIAWCAALYFFGPKISKATGKKGFVGSTVGGAMGAAAQAKSWLEKTLGGKS